MNNIHYTPEEVEGLIGKLYAGDMEPTEMELLHSYFQSLDDMPKHWKAAATLVRILAVQAYCSRTQEMAERNLTRNMNKKKAKPKVLMTLGESWMRYVGYAAAWVAIVIIAYNIPFDTLLWQSQNTMLSYVPSPTAQVAMNKVQMNENLPLKLDDKDVEIVKKAIVEQLHQAPTQQVIAHEVAEEADNIEVEYDAEMDKILQSSYNETGLYLADADLQSYNEGKTMFFCSNGCSKEYVENALKRNLA